MAANDTATWWATGSAAARWLGEVVVTAGLVLLITALSAARRRRCHRHDGLRRRLPHLSGQAFPRLGVADPNHQPIGRVRDIRDDLQARITALLRDLDI